MTGRAMSERARRISIWDPGIVRQAVLDSFKKLDPRVQVKNPVMFIVEVGSLLTTIIFVQELAGGTGNPLFTGQVAVWLWFTVVFANFAEAMAEGRGKAQAETLRKARTETVAHRLTNGGHTEDVPASKLRKGDLVMVRAGDYIPSDGEIVEGVASVDESAITGESAPVIRESGRRPLRGDGRHPRHLRLDQGAHHGRARPHLPGPHDRARGRGRAPEDAQRDRAEHPARGAHPGLPAGGGHPAPVRALRRHHHPHPGPRLAARLPDPHHHRRAHLRHRDRGHGPAGPAQRARHVRPRGGGRGRRGHPAPRQDGHHHPGQPAGHRAGAGLGRHRDRAGRRRPARLAWPTRRPKAARSWSWPRRGTRSADGSWPTSLRPSCRSRRRPGCPASTWTAGRSARARPTPSSSTSPATAAPSRPSCRARWTASRGPGARRWWWRSGRGRSGSSTSRTSSRAASGSGSKRSGPWGSRR